MFSLRNTGTKTHYIQIYNTDVNKDAIVYVRVIVRIILVIIFMYQIHISYLIVF